MDALTRTTASTTSRARAPIVRKDRAATKPDLWKPTIVPAGARAALGDLNENESNSHRVLAAKRASMLYQKGRADTEDPLAAKRQQRAVARHERALEKKIANDSSAAAITREYEHRTLQRESEMTRLMRGDYVDEKIRKRRRGVKGPKFTEHDTAITQAESRYDRSKDLKRHNDIIAYQLRP